MNNSSLPDSNRNTNSTLNSSEEVYLSLLLPIGDNINLGACSLQEDIEDEDFGGIVEDELHFKDHGDNTIVITNNPNKF